MSETKALLAIVQETNELEKMLVQSEGVLTPELEAALVVKEIQLPEKIDNYAGLRERMEMLSDYYKERADKLLALSKAAARVIDRLDENLKLAMRELKVDELVGNDHRFALQSSAGAVFVEDETKIHGAYVVTETITKLDKKRILEDLRLGVPVVGCRLEKSQFVKAYSNSPARKKKEKK